MTIACVLVLYMYIYNDTEKRCVLRCESTKESARESRPAVSARFGDAPRRRDRSSTLPDLLSSLSQSVTLPFQSQVCLSKSKASPLGHVICFRPDLVHLSVGEPVDRKTKGVCVSLTRERDAMFAYSRARRSSSRSSSSRRSAARCRTRGRSGSAPSPAWSRRSRSLCRTWDIYIIPHMEKCTCLSFSLSRCTREEVAKRRACFCPRPIGTHNGGKQQ